MHWILSPEPKTPSAPMPFIMCIEDLLVSKDFIEKGRTWLKEKLALENDSIQR